MGLQYNINSKFQASMKLLQTWENKADLISLTKPYFCGITTE